MKEKAVITAAISGAIHTPGMTPYLPITPQEIANEAVRAYEAGAAVCHIHVRDPEQVDQRQTSSYLDKQSSAKDKCNMIICITSGGGLGASPEQRLMPLSIFKPELVF